MDGWGRTIPLLAAYIVNYFEVVVVGWGQGRVQFIEVQVVVYRS